MPVLFFRRMPSSMPCNRRPQYPGGYDPNCKIGYVEDTEFVSQESTAVQGGREPPWRELWTLVSCVQKMQVPMLFIPDSTGTSISAGPNSAVKVIPLQPSGH
jgi:hypothetical protein